MPRPNATNRLTNKLKAAEALEAEIKALRAREREREKATTEARYRLAGRELVGCLEREPDSDVARAVLALLGAKLIKPAERRLFPELANGSAAVPSPGEPQPAA